MTTIPKPYRAAYTIIRVFGANEKNRRVKIGASAPTMDELENDLLHALPLDGKLQLRTPKAKDTPKKHALRAHARSTYAFRGDAHRSFHLPRALPITGPSVNS